MQKKKKKSKEGQTRTPRTEAAEEGGDGRDRSGTHWRGRPKQRKAREEREGGRDGRNYACVAQPQRQQHEFPPLPSPSSSTPRTASSPPSERNANPPHHTGPAQILISLPFHHKPNPTSATPARRRRRPNLDAPVAALLGSPIRGSAVG